MSIDKISKLMPATDTQVAIANTIATCASDLDELKNRLTDDAEKTLIIDFVASLHNLAAGYAGNRLLEVYACDDDDILIRSDKIDFQAENRADREAELALKRDSFEMNQGARS